MAPLAGRDEEPKLDLERAGAALVAAELLGGQERLERVVTRSRGDISARVGVDRMAVELMPGGAMAGRGEELARSSGSCSVGVHAEFDESSMDGTGVAPHPRSVEVGQLRRTPEVLAAVASPRLEHDRLRRPRDGGNRCQFA
jgi:hypothetical protein